MAKIGIVAGEASGDLLGGHLIQALKSKRPDLEFIGIAGPKMLEAGAQTLFPLERLSVRGYIEVIRHLWGLLKLRRQLLTSLLKQPIDLFIGIDAPDFNFWLEEKLKHQGIPTVHYVSPSIWAWRKGRLGRIKRAVSHILALFPFEPGIYRRADIPVTYVGHPLADLFPIEPDLESARKALRLETSTTVIALLPGSRQSEVAQHAKLFVKTAHTFYQVWLAEGKQDIVFLVPLITRETRDIFNQACSDFYLTLPATTPSPMIKVMFGHAHEAMSAADLVIVASGTATLEAALLKKPMIITYRMSNLSWQLLKRMRYQPYVGLPNILAERFVVPELLQSDATAEKITHTAMELLGDKLRLEEIRAEFTRMHQYLRQDTAEVAAQAILKLL